MTAGFHATDRAVLRVSGPGRPRLPAGPRHQRRAPPRPGAALRRAAVAAGQVPVRLLPRPGRRRRADRRQGRPRRGARPAPRPLPPARQGRDRADRPRGRRRPRRRRRRAPSPTRATPASAGAPTAPTRRRCSPAPTPLDPAALTARRVALGVPETGVELLPDDSYILEMGFERLNGVDFRKGCYVGQEVTARMKHKTELRKGLARVRLDGPAPPPGTAILRRRPLGRHALLRGRRPRPRLPALRPRPASSLTGRRGSRVHAGAQTGSESRAAADQVDNRLKSERVFSDIIPDPCPHADTLALSADRPFTPPAAPS